MGAIFLSYAREDRACAQKLAQALEAANHSVWWDRHLDGGEEFSAEIEAALDHSDVVLVAWSKDSVKSRWVRDEASVGGEADKLIPITIDGSLPPMGFRQFHTLDLTGWRGAKRDQRTAELLQSVERRLGHRRTPSAASTVAPKPSVPHPNLIRAWVVAIFVLLIAAAAGALLWHKARNSSDEPVKPTIALAPFTMAAPDPELRIISSQARDSLAASFSQSGLPLQVLTSPAQGNTPPADFVLSGDLSRNGGKILATIRLDEVAHKVTVYTHRVEADEVDSRALPERIGAQIAAGLTGKYVMLSLDRRYPLDPAVIADIITSDFLQTDRLQAYQQARRAVQKAPDFAATQLNLAFSGAFALVELPRDERDQALAEARQAAERAMALEPSFGDVHATWCVLHNESLMAECEDQLRVGKRIDPDAPWLNTFLSQLLRGAGRLDEATQLAKLSQTHDPYSPQKIAWLLRELEYSGDQQAAQQIYEQGVHWWPEFKPFFLRNRLLGLFDVADFAAAAQLEEKEGASKLFPHYLGSERLANALATKSLASAKQACPRGVEPMMAVRCMIVLAMLNDGDAAYAIAAEFYPRRIGRTPAETERIWLDDPGGAGDTEFITSKAAAPMRRDPRYLVLAERTGLLAYWRSGRTPDFCRTKPEPICPQLLARH